jgi:aquaporin Z
MLKLLVEFIGTFLFFSVILKWGEALPIAVALAAAIYFGGHISGGNFNPGVSLMMFLTDKLSQAEFLQYVLVQGLAAFSAVYFAKLTAGTAA